MAVLFWVFFAIILYTYLGYPLVLYLLARIKSVKTLKGSWQPTVTLLIAAYNEEDCIAQKLENSLQIVYPADKLQILVAADGSDDQTVAIVNSFAPKGVALSYQPLREGKMAAINRALELARGEIIVFSDANNHYPADTIQALVDPMIDPRVGGVSGAKTIVWSNDTFGHSEGSYWKYESFIKQQETRLGSCTAVSGEIFAMRRDLFEATPRRIINDDFFLAMHILRKGYRVVYTREARSFETVSLTAQDEIVRRARINAGRFQTLKGAWNLLPVQYPLIIWQVISHKYLRLVIPFCMIGLLLTNMLAVFFPLKDASLSFWKISSPFNWIFLLAQIAFYFLAMLGNHSNKGGKLKKLLYLPTFLFNSNFAVLAGFNQSLRKKNNVLWKRVARAKETPSHES